MNKILGIVILGLLLIIFSNTAQANLCRNDEKTVITNSGGIGCVKKGFFNSIGDTIDNVNPLNYFKKKKKCQAQADRADTVAIGKNYYKHCMSRG